MTTLVYSLQLELEPTKPGTSLMLIAPLDCHGRAKDCRPATTGKKFADVQPAEWILHSGRRYHVIGVKPYRSHKVTDEFARYSYKSRVGYFRL